MNKTLGRSLWSDLTKTRHFLIPDSENLASGDFALRTVTGRQQEVDPDALAPYEVSQEEAKEWLKGQFGQVMEQAKGALLEALRPLQEPRYRPPRRRQPRAPSGAGSAQPSPVLTLFAALSGEPVERLKSDPEAVTRGLRHVVDELGAIVEDAAARDEARLETAKERVRGLRAMLNLHGIPVSDKVDALPDRLRQLQRAAEAPEQRAASAAALEALAQGLEEMAGKAAERLRRLAEESRAPSASPESPASDEDPPPSQAGRDPDEEER